jgi:hypothetical protein
MEQWLRLGFSTGRNKECGTSPLPEDGTDAVCETFIFCLFIIPDDEQIEEIHNSEWHSLFNAGTCVTIDRVWIGNQIYRSDSDRNYKYL